MKKSVYGRALLYYLASSLLSDVYSCVDSASIDHFNEPSALELDLAQYEEDVANDRIRIDTIARRE